MILVGQSLELARPKLRHAIVRHDAAPIVKRAQRQVAAGAHALDLNGGMHARVDDLVWVAHVLRSASIEIPLWLDAADPSTLATALHESRDAGPLVANAWPVPDAAKDAPVLEAAARTGAGLVISPRHADGDAPASAEALASTCVAAIKRARSAGVSGAVYLDALASPPSVDPARCRRSLDVLRLFARVEGAVPLVAVGNVSAGVTGELGAAIRRVYAAAATGAGAGALILPVEDAACVHTVRLASGDAFARDIDETYLAALPHATAHGEQPAPPPSTASALLREAWRMIFAD